MPVIIDGTNGLTFPDTSRQYNGYFGFKNRIINGDMRIDQRNAGASVAITTSDNYTLDRWQGTASANSRYTVQRDAGAVTPPAGFTNYLGATSVSSGAPGSTDSYLISQFIEGFNVADLGWGTANAQTVTLSFWVRSSLTGAFGGTITNSAGNRSYPFAYTISAANTWEQKSVTITGDTSGTWLTNNGIGLRVRFSMGMGSSLLGTAGAWAAGFVGAPTGSTNVIATNGATFYVTGVQLEEGVVSTNFDVRPYGTELSLCQRYYYRVYGAGVFGSGYANSATESRYFVPIPTTLRVAPTAVDQSGTAANYQIRSSGGLTTICNGVPVFVSATTNSAFLTSTVASGLTTGQGILIDSGSASAYLGFSAEL